ncbi:MAG TPA: T9SS type A sorting domain-containing protein, partial [Salinivirgaceae bacterium]|nr:T9SS type A sorting domain-containing protein [Salinivirgaceae bacterium]
DMGSNWELVKSGVAVYGIAFAPDNAIYIGCSNEHMLQGGVFRSTDNGLNWELLITGMSTLYMQKVLGLQLTNNGFLYAYGYHILRSTEPVVGINNTNLSQTPIVYPNPASKSVHIELKQYLIKTVEIFDLQGKKIVAEQNNLSNHIEISILGILSGIYIVKVQHSSEIYYEYLIVNSN